MITIITDITDSDILKTYWCPLICKYREMQFIFGRTKDVIRPKMKDWSNVRFAAKNTAERLVSFANTKYIYMTVQNEIPTYGLMVKLRSPEEGIISNKIYLNNIKGNITSIEGTDENRCSYIVTKENFTNNNIPDKVINDVSTYLI